jgi:hypothetical protein
MSGSFSIQQDNHAVSLHRVSMFNNSSVVDRAVIKRLSVVEQLTGLQTTLYQNLANTDFVADQSLVL